MILAAIILLPFAGGLLAWAFGSRGASARWLCLVTLVLDLVMTLATLVPRHEGWIEQLDWPWIPQLGIRIHLAVDGVSLLMVLLTLLLGIVSVLASWSEITERVGFFHLNLMWSLVGVLGVFLALDLFLFYFFWELMLVPMYFLIGIWGHERRTYAAIKFFLFTQASGLFMLLAILGLWWVHHRATGQYTFDYLALLGTPMTRSTARWLMLGFVVAFFVKLPAVPLHTWLPDAHTEAPTAGSVILAGLLLKTGAYGLLRFVVPLFPGAASAFAPIALIVGVVGILYGAVLAFAQPDLKRLVAYTSVSHLGFVLVGIFSGSILALEGAVMQMICHGLSTGALFMLAGSLQERLHTRELARMGGMWSAVPKMGAVGMFFAMASLGLPGLGNFVGEFLVLVGTWQHHPVIAVLAAVGLVPATIYSLWLVQRVFHGPRHDVWTTHDLSARDLVAQALLVAGILWLGLYPQPVLDEVNGALGHLPAYASVGKGYAP
jgi:NADH-quinone oxidoreductase subunit M